MLPLIRTVGTIPHRYLSTRFLACCLRYLGTRYRFSVIASLYEGFYWFLKGKTYFSLFCLISFLFVILIFLLRHHPAIELIDFFWWRTIGIFPSSPDRWRHVVLWRHPKYYFFEMSLPIASTWSISYFEFAWNAIGRFIDLGCPFWRRVLRKLKFNYRFPSCREQICHGTNLNDFLFAGWILLYLFCAVQIVLELPMLQTFGWEIFPRLAFCKFAIYWPSTFIGRSSTQFLAIMATIKPIVFNVVRHVVEYKVVASFIFVYCFYFSLI